MGVSFTLEKRHAYVLVAVLVIVFSLAFVAGFGSTDPSFHGHSSGELAAGTLASGFSFTPNVGIGTSTPDQPLTVNGSGDTFVHFVNTNTGTTGGDGTFVGIDSSGHARLQNSEALDVSLWTGNSPRLTVLGGAGGTQGFVGIGDTTPVTQLEVAFGGDGNTLQVYDSDAVICSINPGVAADWSCSSDARLKEDIRDAQPVLADLMNVRVRDFTIKSTGQEYRGGVVAQELEQVMPDLVSVGTDGYLSVRDVSSWKLVKAIQELKVENDVLRAQNAQLARYVCLDHPEAEFC